jgi:hypothetical protein
LVKQGYALRPALCNLQAVPEAAPNAAARVDGTSPSTQKAAIHAAQALWRQARRCLPDLILLLKM